MRWGIIGNGTWARALGQTLKRNALPKTIQFWARAPRQSDETNDLSALQGADVLLWCASTAALGHIALPANTPVILACKGIQYEKGELRLPTDWLSNRPVGVLSGPTFAHEVAQNLPAAIVLASQHPDATMWADHIKHLHFRVYLSSDVIGTQVGGAVKNVVALASGLCMGLKLGQNAAAALITRGLCEIQRIGAHFGANPLTLTGLSGLGDMILTSNSLDSRNTKLGYDIAQGASLQQAISQASGVAEGVRTVQSLYQAGETMHLPIVTTLHRILFESLPPQDSVTQLLSQQRDPHEFPA